MPVKHALPGFLVETITSDSYEKWLSRKAKSHVRRDRKRGRICSIAVYKEEIHKAVVASCGFDAYTGERLDWALISTYRNDDSKAGRHGYKAGFALLPTVDHLASESSEPDFRICSWRTNDAKNDLSLDAFLDVCRKVLVHAGFEVSARTK